MNSSLLSKLFIIYAILHEPMTSFFYLPDRNGRMPVLLFLICCLCGSQYKVFFKSVVSIPMFFWLLWVLYSLVNWLAVGISPVETTLIGFLCVHLILPMATMVVIYQEGCRDLKGTLMLIIGTHVVYMLMGLTMQDMGDVTLAGEKVRGGQILGNGLPLSACTFAFAALLANVNGWLKGKYVCIVMALVFGTIFMVATRKALFAVIIMLFFYMLAKMSVRKPITVFISILICICAYTAFNLAMSYTLMGERMATVRITEKNVKSTPLDHAAGLVGDRSYHYMLGWKAFQKHPITGVGLTNVPRIYHFKYPLHTEYMVQLAEGGIVGTSIWLLFIGGMFWNIIKARKYKPRSAILVCLSGMFAIMFINITAWTYDSVRFFIIYGLILAYCKPLAEQFLIHVNGKTYITRLIQKHES